MTDPNLLLSKLTTVLNKLHSLFESTKFIYPDELRTLLTKIMVSNDIHDIMYHNATDFLETVLLGTEWVGYNSLNDYQLLCEFLDQNISQSPDDLLDTLFILEEFNYLNCKTVINSLYTLLS